MVPVWLNVRRLVTVPPEASKPLVKSTRTTPSVTARPWLTSRNAADPVQLGVEEAERAAAQLVGEGDDPGEQGAGQAGPAEAVLVVADRPVGEALALPDQHPGVGVAHEPHVGDRTVRALAEEVADRRGDELA